MTSALLLTSSLQHSNTCVDTEPLPASKMLENAMDDGTLKQYLADVSQSMFINLSITRSTTQLEEVARDYSSTSLNALRIRGLKASMPPRWTVELRDTC